MTSTSVHVFSKVSLHHGMCTNIYNELTCCFNTTSYEIKNFHTDSISFSYQMPLPPAGRKLKHNHPSLQHPYAFKVDTKLLKLDAVLNGIFDVADGDLLVSNAETGLTNVSLNEKFAKKLEEVSKCVAGLAN